MNAKTYWAIVLCMVLIYSMIPLPEHSDDWATNAGIWVGYFLRPDLLLLLGWNPPEAWWFFNLWGILVMSAIWGVIWSYKHGDG